MKDYIAKFFIGLPKLSESKVCLFSYKKKLSVKLYHSILKGSSRRSPLINEQQIEIAVLSMWCIGRFDHCIMPARQFNRSLHKEEILVLTLEQLWNLPRNSLNDTNLWYRRFLSNFLRLIATYLQEEKYLKKTISSRNLPRKPL